MVLYLIRHGKYENPNQVVPLRMEGFPLSAEGIKDIEEDAKYLEEQRISKIFYSPMQRTKQTAEIIGKKLNIKPEVSDLLIETNSPAFQGLKVEEYDKRLKGTEIYKDKYHLENKGETKEEILERMSKFCEGILSKYPDQNIVAVSHGDPIMIYVNHLKDKDIVFTAEFGSGNEYIPKGRIIRIEFGNDQELLSIENINF